MKSFTKSLSIALIAALISVVIYDQYFNNLYDIPNNNNNNSLKNTVLIPTNYKVHTNSIADVNDVLIEYGELFPNEYLTLDGTLNYVLQLLCSKITTHEDDLRKYSI